MLRFIDNWTGTPLSSVQPENAGGFTAPTSLPWVRLSVRELVRRQHTMGAPGNRVFASRAMLIAQIFVPRGEGTDELDALAQEFRELFEGVEADGLTFYDVQVPGPIDGDPYIQVNAQATFEYHETR